MAFSLRKLLGAKSAETELVFEDRFSRPDGKDVGPGWHNPQGAARISAGTLRVENGWTSLSGSYPGNVRIEAEILVEKASPAMIGLFLCGSEGFWNGYEVYAAPLRMELRRYGTPMAVLAPSPLMSGKKALLFMEREGAVVRAGIGDKILLEFLDMEPLPEESQTKAGVHSWGCLSGISRIRVQKFKAREKLGPLSVGDKLLRRRMYQAALTQYNNAIPVLDPEERASARLRSIVCLGRLGRHGEALSALVEFERQASSPSALRQALRLRFEQSIPAQSWEDFETTFGRIEKGAEYLAERSAVLDALGRPDRVWEARNLWAGPRFNSVFDTVSSWPESWNSQRASRALLRFLRIIQGPDSVLDRVPELQVLARGLEGSGPGLEVLGQIEAEARYLHSGARPSPVDAATALEELEKGGRYPRRELLDRCWSPEGTGLDPFFDQLLATASHLDEAYRFRRYADYALGRGHVEASRKYYDATLKRFPTHGSVSCGCLVTLAALELWEGRPEPARRLAQRALDEYKAEVWAGPFARLFTGRGGTLEFFHDWDREALWTQDPPAMVGFLALAAREKADRKLAGIRTHLEMIQGIAFPWEASFDAAGNWLKASG